MSWRPQAPTALDYFASLVHSDVDFPLLEAAASLGQMWTPELDVQAVLEEVDRMLARLLERIPEGADDLTRLALLNQQFHGDWGFALNRNHYHDPRNSDIARVLHTRRGIPVSLAVLWIELARGLQLQADGISFPGHFLVKVHLDAGLVVLDPVSGESLGVDALAERLAPFRGEIDRQALADLDEGETPLGLYLQSCPPRDWLARMLRNLKDIEQTQERWPELLKVLDRLVILLPEAWSERRDRGLVHAELGHAGLALTDLQVYLRECPQAPDAKALQRRMETLGGA